MSSPRHRWLLLTLLLVALIASTHAQQQAVPPVQEPSLPAAEQQEPPADAQQPSVPVFRTGINFIRVDVIVTDDDGNHVTDLEASDFEVFEDDEPQSLESFQLVEISAVPAPGAEPPREVHNRYDEEREAARADTRVFVIFFDDYHVRYENGIRAGLAIAEFLRNNLIPTDLVGIMYPLTPLEDVRLTRNHEAIIDAAENFFGRKYRYEPTNMFEERYAYYPTEIVVRLRNDVSLSALEGLMIHLGGLREARKNVLLVSEGFTNYVPPELRAANAQDFAASSAFASASPFEESAQFFSDSGLFFDLRDVFSTANRFNTTIYALDPRGLAISEYDVSQPSVNSRTDTRVLRATRDTLYVLASETDGRVIVNTNDLVPGLKQMMRDSSAYYLLGYNSSRSPTDGKYHEIEVRVRRDDVDVRHRKGFWAMTERDVERALTTTINEPPKAVDTALAALAEPRRGRRLVRTWVGTARGENGRTKVTFLWEPVSDGRSGGGTPARVLLTAMGESGGAYYRGRVPEQAGSAGARRRAAPAASTVTRVVFEVDPGTLQLSMAVEDETGEVLDRDRDELDVPDFTGTDLELSTPSFVRARNHLEWKALVDDWEAVPTPSHEFRRTERLILRFEAYAAGTETPDVRARLLNRGGDLIHPLDIQPAENGHPYQVDLLPAHLPPGEYVIELDVTTPTSEITRLVAFRLTS